MKVAPGCASSERCGTTPTPAEPALRRRHWPAAAMWSLAGLDHGVNSHPADPHKRVRGRRTISKTIQAAVDTNPTASRAPLVSTRGPVTARTEARHAEMVHFDIAFLAGIVTAWWWAAMCCHSACDPAEGLSCLVCPWSSFDISNRGVGAGHGLELLTAKGATSFTIGMENGTGVCHRLWCGVPCRYRLGDGAVELPIVVSAPCFQRRGDSRHVKLTSPWMLS